MSAKQTFLLKFQLVLLHIDHQIHPHLPRINPLTNLFLFLFFLNQTYRIDCVWKRSIHLEHTPTFLLSFLFFSFFLQSEILQSKNIYYHFSSSFLQTDTFNLVPSGRFYSVSQWLFDLSSFHERIQRHQTGIGCLDFSSE